MEDRLTRPLYLSPLAPILGVAHFFTATQASPSFAGCGDIVQLAKAESGYMLQGSWSVLEYLWPEILQVAEGLELGMGVIRKPHLSFTLNEAT